jgi:hypothetical protein
LLFLLQVRNFFITTCSYSKSNWQVLCHVRRRYCLQSIWQVCSPIWRAGSRYATTTAVFCAAAPDPELAFPRSIRQCRNLRLKKLSTSGPSTLPFSSPSSSRPSYNNCLHLSWRTSPFRKLQHKTSSRSPQLLQRSSPFPQKLCERGNKNCARLPSQHTPTSHTHTMLLHFLRQLDHFAQTLALRSLSTWQVVVQKRKETDENEA